jgi:maltose alpha-D-glucosyltransferase/alpha-amylase
MKKSLRTHNGLNPEPFWYKSGVIYELHVRAFADSDDNGIGDFRGLTSKLDYLKDLGITALWLLPFYPSPLKDDGYDTADYFDVHPMYGTLADFKVFLKEAHKRGLRVITELVLNHTSDQHPWFQRSRRAAPGSRWRDFYVWSDTPEKYKDARIIFKDIEVSNWSHDPVAGAYFWHRFFSHQPDLNWENPEVYKEMVKVIDFWFDMGVDGLRLDAVPYLFEREGTSCENLPETHQVLKRLRKHVDQKYGDRMLLGEANQWPEDAVAYFGEGAGDECHMAFHFPLMPRLFMSLRMEDRLPIVDILEQTPEIPETSQWALFLRNHDELTLEMVTDEERDYMYRMYAHVNRARLNLGIRRRLAPLLGNDRRRIELMNAILLSLPGTPVLYYGDEIGMGENIYLGDRNGVRTPMQWSSDKNAGFSRANPQALFLPIIYDPEYHYEAVNVESQSQNPHSLLWWTRRLLALRKRYRALGEGRCEFLHPENHKILAYYLTFGEETILVVANLSRFVQPVELDLAEMTGHVPIELFGRMPFPEITPKPYFLTLSPHAFYWFLLEHPDKSPAVEGTHAAPLAVAGDWTTVFTEKTRTQLEARLAVWLPQQPWFVPRVGNIRQVGIQGVVSLPDKNADARIVFLNVAFIHGENEVFSVPLAFTREPQASDLRHSGARGIVCDLTAGAQEGVLHDALASPGFCNELLKLITKRRTHRNGGGELEGTSGTLLRQILGGGPLPEPAQMKSEQRNSSVVFGDKVILKWFRRLGPGENAEIAIGTFLNHRGVPHIQRLAGSLRFTADKGGGTSLAALNEYIPNARNAWEYTAETLGRYYERIASEVRKGESPPKMDFDWATVRETELPPDVAGFVGSYLDSARVLGERTAELHLALSSVSEDSSFAPEPFTPHYVRGLFQSMRNATTHNFRALRKQLDSLPPSTAALARKVLTREEDIMESYRALQGRRLESKRIRCHGDLNLKQALYTGKDLMLIDFEGDPAATVSERSIKRCALLDVAGMMRSFHYAAWSGLHDHMQRGGLEPESIQSLEPWARLWYRAVSLEYLRAYLAKADEGAATAQSPGETAVLLPAYLFSHAMHELGRELANRPDWMHIPLRGILSLLETLETGDP